MSNLAEKDAQIDGLRKMLIEARAEVERLRGIEADHERWENFSNMLAEKMPPEFDGDEAQEYLIDNWVTSLVTENERLAEQVRKATLVWNDMLNTTPRDDYFVGRLADALGIPQAGVVTP